MKHALKLIPAALLAFSMGAQAAVNISIQEIDGDVVLRGSGSLNIENMQCEDIDANPTSINSKDASGGFSLFLQPLIVYFNITQTVNDDLMICSAYPVERTGGGIRVEDLTISGSSTGDLFGFVDFSDDTDNPAILLILPANYISGTNMSFSGLLEGKSLAALDLIVGGGYTWTWSTQPASRLSKATNTESLSIKVLDDLPPASATSVPALGAFGLMGLASAVGAAGVAMNRRRKQ